MLSLQDVQESRFTKAVVFFLVSANSLIPFYAWQLDIRALSFMQSKDFMLQFPFGLLYAISAGAGQSYPLEKYGCAVAGAFVGFLIYLASFHNTKTSKGINLLFCVLATVMAQLCCCAIILMIIVKGVYTIWDAHQSSVYMYPKDGKLVENCFIALGFFQPLTEIFIIPAVIALTPRRRCGIVVAFTLFMKLILELLVRGVTHILMKMEEPSEEKLESILEGKYKEFPFKVIPMSLAVAAAACSAFALLLLPLGGVFKVENFEVLSNGSFFSVIWDMKLTVIAGCLLWMGGSVFELHSFFLSIMLPVHPLVLAAFIIVGFQYDGKLQKWMCCVPLEKLRSKGVATFPWVISVAKPHLIAFVVMSSVASIMGFTFSALPRSVHSEYKYTLFVVFLLAFAGISVLTLVPMVNGFLVVPLSIHLHQASQRSGKCISMIGACYALIVFFGKITRLIYQAGLDKILKNEPYHLYGEPSQGFVYMAKKFMMLMAAGFLVASLLGIAAVRLYGYEKRTFSESTAGKDEESQSLVK